jgi:hypothetical protein
MEHPSLKDASSAVAATVPASGAVGIDVRPGHPPVKPVLGLDPRMGTDR